MNNNMTLKEYLLSKGVNAKQESFERKVTIDNTRFSIKIMNEAQCNLLELTVKEVFVLAYKSLFFIKNNNSFSIAYAPKEMIVKGRCNKLPDNTIQVSLLEVINYSEALVDKEKNIVIIDEINNVNVELI